MMPRDQISIVVDVADGDDDHGDDDGDDHDDDDDDDDPTRWQCAVTRYSY